MRLDEQAAFVAFFFCLTLQICPAQMKHSAKKKTRLDFRSCMLKCTQLKAAPRETWRKWVRRFDEGGGECCIRVHLFAIVFFLFCRVLRGGCCILDLLWYILQALRYYCTLRRQSTNMPLLIRPWSNSFVFISPEGHGSRRRSVILSVLVFRVTVCATH